MSNEKKLEIKVGNEIFSISTPAENLKSDQVVDLIKFFVKAGITTYVIKKACDVIESKK